jgi:hypothetical protein
MAFQVLLASTGFAMYEHWCLMRGSKTVSLVHKETCSIRHNEILKTHSKECANSIQRSKCCAEKVSLQKIQTPSSHGYSVDLVGQYGGAILTLLPVFFSSTSWFSPSVSFCLPHYYSAAPPLHGRSMLVFIQSFLI